MSMQTIGNLSAHGSAPGNGSYVRYFQIRRADDGFSLFTWQDHAKLGQAGWSEEHGLEFNTAYELAREWLGV